MDWPSDPMPPRLRAPLFPLPNVVLLPGAILPLHIFEPRYKRMTADALDGERLIVMALLRAGWEKSYYERPAIEPVVCIGRIVAHERLPDGKYNVLLQGQWRATVLDENSSGGPTAYRVASAAPLAESEVMEIDLSAQRRRLIQTFEVSSLGAEGLGKQFARLLGGPMPTARIADLLAFNYLEDVALKQSLLAEPDIVRRVERVACALEEMGASAGPPGPRQSLSDASLN